MMHFAIFLPDWNSLDSVRRVHSDLEGSALVFFALLVVFEVLSHNSDDKKRERLFDRIGLWFFGVAILSEILAYPYGQRNDAFSAQVIGSLDAKAQDASAAAARAKTTADGAEIKADLWQLGKHRVLCGNSLVAENYTLLMDGAKADLVITDSPYNCVIDGHASGLGRVQVMR
jgi:hypothetical protein